MEGHTPVLVLLGVYIVQFQYAFETRLGNFDTHGTGSSRRSMRDQREHGLLQDANQRIISMAYIGGQKSRVKNKG